MSHIIRDTTFGATVRFLSRNRLLRYQDQCLDRVRQHAEFTVHHTVDGDAVWLVDWIDPHDVDNPSNWSPLKKIAVTSIICFLTFAIYVGSAIYTPGINAVRDHFLVSRTVSELPLTLYVIGYGLGPIVFAPLSENVHIGRNPVYLSTLFIFVLLQIPTALTNSFTALCILRFLGGIFASPALANGGASICDIYDALKAPYVLPIWASLCCLGPLLGPLLGAAMVVAEDYRFTFWMLMWLSGIALIIAFFFLPETLSSKILHDRANRLRANDQSCPKSRDVTCTDLSPSHLPYVTAAELEDAKLTTSERAYEIFLRPFAIMCTEPGVMALNVYLGLIYAIIYCWFEAFPIIYSETYNFTLIESSTVFAGFGISNIIALVLYKYVILDRKVRPHIKAALFDMSEPFVPEIFLQFCVYFAPMLPILLLAFGWSASSRVHWIVPTIFAVLTFMPMFLLFQIVFLYLSFSYPRYVASVFAGNDAVRSSIAGVFPLFAYSLFHNLGPASFPVGWGTTVLAACCLVLCAVPILMFYHGELLRGRSKYAN